jgi:hypothetical protein
LPQVIAEKQQGKASKRAKPAGGGVEKTRVRAYEN